MLPLDFEISAEQAILNEIARSKHEQSGIRLHTELAI